MNTYVLTVGFNHDNAPLTDTLLELVVTCRKRIGGVTLTPMERLAAYGPRALRRRRRTT
jgi:hypothetical protein